MGRLIVNHIKNPFDPWGSREIREFPSGMTVKEYIDRLPIPSEGYDYAVSVDGLLLSETADLTVCRPASSLVVCAVPQGSGDGGKNPLKTIAMLAVVIVAAVASWYVGGAGGWALAAGYSAGQAAAMGAVAGAAVMMAGSMLVNALFPVNIPDITGGVADFSKSATYGWDVAGNSDRENVPWPVLYGAHRVCPPIIGKYVEVVDDKQYLNILYAVADHAIDEIDEDTVEINGNAAVQGENGVTWEIRLGSVDQPVIQYFNDTRVAKTAGSKLSTDWTTVQTDGNAVEGLGVAFSLPRGLFYGADDGSLATASVKIDLEFRILPAGEWVRLQGKNQTVLALIEPRWSSGFWTWYPSVTWNEVAEGSETPADHVEGDVSYDSGYEFIFGETGGNRVIYTWHWLEAAVTHNAPGTETTDYVEIAAAQSSPLRRIYYMDRMPAGQYEVRVRLHEAPPSGTRYSNDVWFDYVEETIYDDFAYPGTALFALRALATDRFSGGLPKVSFEATRSAVSVWTGAAYENKDANLSAWQAWDILHNEDYGGGVACSRLPVAPFQEWADYCTTKGYHSNIYFDSIVNMRKALDMVGAVGEGAVAQMGSRFTCYVDGEVDLPVQSFMFADANVIRDTYSESYLPSDDRANAVEVTFWDAANGHKRTTFEIPAADFDSTTEEIKRTSLILTGCTSRDEAIKHGIRALNRNRYLTLTASWEAGFDSIGCLPWDPVVAPLGLGGRVVSGTANSVTIDQQVLLEPGHTYIVRVKSGIDDTAEEATIAAVEEETLTDTLTIMGAFTHTPQLHEMFLFYEQGEDVRMMRVLSITRRDDMTRKITAIEYSAAALDDTGTVPAPETVTDTNWLDHLRAEEIWRGGAETRAQLSWTGFAILWRVWYRRTATTEAWTYAGETTTPAYEIRGLDYGPEYEFAVSHTRNPVDGETVTLTLVGKTTPPGDVGTVTASPREDGITFSWPKVPDFDLVGYRIRTGVQWAVVTTYSAGMYLLPTDGTEKRYVCTTAGVSGGTEPTWPAGTGETVSDGTVLWTEDTATWDYAQVQSTSFNTDLTTAEKAAQAWGNSVMAAFVIGIDAFGNVSATTAHSTGTCLNYKPSISVGVTTVLGTFTDLMAAIAQLPSGGGAICIKNGTYQMSGVIAFPDKNLDVFGESRGGVIVRNNAGSDLFTLHNLTKNFSFSAFTIESQNVASFSNMFKIYGEEGEESQNSASVSIESVSLVLSDSGTYQGNGDTGVYAYRGEGGKLSITKQCSFLGGKRGLYSFVFSNREISSCILSGQTDYSISGAEICSNNTIEDFLHCGIYGVRLASGNVLSSRNDSLNPGHFIGIMAASQTIGNTVTITNTRPTGYMTGIWAATLCPVMGNTVAITASTSGKCRGVLLNAITDSGIMQNIIQVNNAGAGINYGIEFDKAYAE